MIESARLYSYTVDPGIPATREQEVGALVGQTSVALSENLHDGSSELSTGRASP